MVRQIEIGVPKYSVTLTGGSGTWTLSYDGLTTTPAFTYTQDAAAVQTALRALASVGAASTVTGAAGGPYTITIITPVQLGDVTAAPTLGSSAIPTVSRGYTLVDVTDFIPVGIGDSPNGFPLTTVEVTDGAQPDITFTILTEWMRGASLQQLSVILPGGLQSKQTVLDHDGTEVYFAGRIDVIETDPSGPANLQYQVTAGSYMNDLYKPVGYISFPPATIVYNGQTFNLTRDTHRVMYLLATHLPDWYHDFTYIPDAAYTTYTTANGYYKTNVYNILKDIAAHPGPDLATPVAPRSWLVGADSAGFQYLAYFSRTGGTGAAPISITSVAASSQRAKFWDGRRISDTTRMINGLVIAGPDGEPAPVSYSTAHNVNVTVRDDLLIKTAGVDALWNAGAFGVEDITSEGGYLEATMQREVRGWLPSHSYVVGDYVMGTDAAALIVYKCTVAGTSGVGAPTWVLVADGLFTEAASTLTWKCHRWKATRVYAAGEYVVRTTSTGQLFKCTTGGTSGASQPAWNVTENGTTPDGVGALVWTTRTHSAVAMGFSTTNADANWNTIRFGVTATYGSIDVVYQGAVLSAAVATHGVGARIKVDIMRAASSTGALRWRGEVYRDNGTGYERVYAVLFSYDQMDDGTHGGANRFPLYPDFSLYYLGNSLRAATIRAHSYSEFQRLDSVGAYGEHWAADVLRDDTLDTVEKRLRKAEQIFDARAYPRVTFTCTTDGLAPSARYQLHAGKLLPVYEPKFGWNPQQLIINRITTEWETDYIGGGNFGPPLQYLELGDRLLEDGEDDDFAWLVRIREEDVGSPPYPPSVVLLGNRFDPERQLTALEIGLTASPSPNIVQQHLYLRQGADPYVAYPIGLATNVIVYASPGVVFAVYATAFQSIGGVVTESAPSNTIEGVTVIPPVPVPDINGGFEEYFGQQYDVPLRWVRSFDAAGGTSDCRRYYVANFANGGVACLLLSKTSGIVGNPSALSYYQTVQGGKSYIVKLWRRTDTASCTGLVEVVWHDNSATPAIVQTDTVPLDPAPIGGWSYFQYTFIAPMTASIARIRLTNDFASAPSQLWFDDIKFDEKVEAVDLVQYLHDKLYNGAMTRPGKVATQPDGYTFALTGAGTAQPTLDNTHAFGGLQTIKCVLTAGQTITITSDRFKISNPASFKYVAKLFQYVQMIYHATQTGATGGTVSCHVVCRDKAHNSTGTLELIPTATTAIIGTVQAKTLRKQAPDNTVEGEMSIVLGGGSAHANTITFWIGELDSYGAATAPQIGTLNINTTSGQPLELTEVDGSGVETVKTTQKSVTADEDTLYDFGDDGRLRLDKTSDPSTFYLETRANFGNLVLQNYQAAGNNTLGASIEGWQMNAMPGKWATLGTAFAGLTNIATTKWQPLCYGGEILFFNGDVIMTGV